MYNTIEKLRPYFFSFREVQNIFSLDIKIPVTWKYDTIVIAYKGIDVTLQDKNKTSCLLSLTSDSTEYGCEMLIGCAEEIIQVNKEAEEKLLLFQEKVKELELLFQKESLNKLKDIHFLDKDEQQKNSNSNRLVEPGVEEGRDRNLEPQTTTN